MSAQKGNADIVLVRHAREMPKESLCRRAPLSFARVRERLFNMTRGDGDIETRSLKFY